MNSKYVKDTNDHRKETNACIGNTIDGLLVLIENFVLKNLDN